MMYFGVACATLLQNYLVQFFAIELISHIHIYKLAITNSEQSRICLFLYVCTNLSKVLPVNGMYNDLFHI